jgi:hypothetical protein
MTSARQNALESAKDGPHYELTWSKKGQENVIAGAARRERSRVPIRRSNVSVFCFVAAQTRNGNGCRLVVCLTAAHIDADLHQPAP